MANKSLKNIKLSLRKYQSNNTARVCGYRYKRYGTINTSHGETLREIYSLDTSINWR
jgi:hypothetical protein